MGPAQPAAEQIGLIPAGSGSPAQVLWFHDAVRQSEASGAEVTSTPKPNGYRLAALVPDRLLGWDRTRATPALELSINVKPAPERPRRRIRLFGVQIWMNEWHRYARLV